MIVLKVIRQKGKAAEFLRHAMGTPRDDCIIWPFTKNKVNGYGLVNLERRPLLVHSVMCQMVHGPRPSQKHYAAHSCHHRACINPLHISWKTHSQNMLDKRANGTASRTGVGRKGKLTPEDASTILYLKGVPGWTQDSIAKAFGITEASVRNIHSGRLWSRRIAEYRAAIVVDDRNTG